MQPRRRSVAKTAEPPAKSAPAKSAKAEPPKPTGPLILAVSIGSQRVTVYDNGDHGGFAGGEPVGKAELFRCAFDKAQGQGASTVGG